MGLPFGVQGVGALEVEVFGSLWVWDRAWVSGVGPGD